MMQWKVSICRCSAAPFWSLRYFPCCFVLVSGNLPCRFALVSVVFSLLVSIVADLCCLFVLVCVKIDISKTGQLPIPGLCAHAPLWGTVEKPFGSGSRSEAVAHDLKL